MPAEAGMNGHNNKGKKDSASASLLNNHRLRHEWAVAIEEFINLFFSRLPSA
jgi:hypothetical protein